MTVRFSVCIPNYNYAKYIVETVESVLSQGRDDLEVCVSDNASTDDSVARVKSIDDDRVKLAVNQVNLGFAPNLDKASSMASGRTLITLSSDDLMLPGALDAYARLLDAVDDRRALVGSAIRVVDSAGKRLGKVAAQSGVWYTSHYDAALSERVGMKVYSAPAAEILANSVKLMCNPFRFATTAFPWDMYERIGGYGGHRLINPDKWFSWRMLGQLDRAYFVNEELFAYRWHQDNQSAQQKASGALKYLVDEYISTFQLDDDLLGRLGLARDDVAEAFLRNDISLHGLRDVADGNRVGARRSVHFALATYPRLARRSPLFWLLRAGAHGGAAGTFLARNAFGPALRLWRGRMSADADLHEAWWPAS